MSESILTGIGVTKKIGVNVILDNVDIEVYKGDFTVIMGASGAGKSTLLYALSGMDGITSGKVIYKEREISSLGEKAMAQLRAKKFGFIFQQIHLVSNLSLFENAAVAGYIGKRPEAEVRKRTAELFQQMNLTEAAERLPCEVSGGEAQRAAIARAVIGNAGIIFADEPTGALNRRNTEEVLNLLTDLNSQGQTILMVTHDSHAALRGNRIIYLDDGKICGELNMGMYSEADERSRKLNNWLQEQRW